MGGGCIREGVGCRCRHIRREMDTKKKIVRCLEYEHIIYKMKEIIKTQQQRQKNVTFLVTEAFSMVGVGDK